MRGVSVSELLNAWEQGLRQSPPERALTLLAAHTELSPDELARLTIGERDWRLLVMREHVFGSQLTSLATCPACDENLEMTLDVADLLIESETVSETQDNLALRGAVELESEIVGDAESAANFAPFALKVAGYEVSFRSPNSRDLIAIEHCEDVAMARQMLLKQCLLIAEHGGVRKSVEQLPATIVEAVAERMSEVDPQADVRFALVCTRCAHNWQETFDINTFFWSEIDAWAKGILREVHTLARAYGWSETEILALNAQRRSFYLEMVQG